MAENSNIGWCDDTFNPIRGCSKVVGHPGCANCYAEVDRSVKLHGVKWGLGGTRAIAAASTWNQPLKWNRKAEKDRRRRRVFSASLGDIFEPWNGELHDHKGERVFNNGDDASPVTYDDIRRRLFGLIDRTTNLDWLLLTKRIDRVREMWPPTDYDPQSGQDNTGAGYRDNVWIGTSVSDQATADKNLSQLTELVDLAPVLFASVEPLLGPVDLSEWIDALDWVIVGGESGPRARPCNVAWVASIVNQCRSRDVPVFVKQLGSKCFIANRITATTGAFAEVKGFGDCSFGPKKLIDKKGGDLLDLPEELRIREFPIKQRAEDAT